MKIDKYVEFISESNKHINELMCDDIGLEVPEDIYEKDFENYEVR